MGEHRADLVVRGKALIDGTGAPAVAPGLVAIAGKSILYGGSAVRAPSFEGARTVDLPDCTLLPGLIDMHVHPTHYWLDGDSFTYTGDEEGCILYSDASLALAAAWKLRQALETGVTTARDTGSVNCVMFNVRRAIALGRIPAPGPAWAGGSSCPRPGSVTSCPASSTRPMAPSTSAGPCARRSPTVWTIKLANNGADLTQEELNAAVDEAHRQSG